MEKFEGVAMDGDPDLNVTPNGLPVVDTIYLVEALSPIPGGLILAGLHVYDRRSGVTVGFNWAKFRKVVPRSERQPEYEEARNMFLSGRMRTRTGFKL